MVKYVIVVIALASTSCVQQKKTNKEQLLKSERLIEKEYLMAVLDTIWRAEQEPITLRDSLMRIYGTESKEYKEQQLIYEKNHIINEKKVRHILDNYGWPKKELIGEQGNWTICNVIQHSDNEIRIKYLPMMKEAVKEKKLALVSL